MTGDERARVESLRKRLAAVKAQLLKAQLEIAFERLRQTHD
jgi:hypothetical protein